MRRAVRRRALHLDGRLGPALDLALALISEQDATGIDDRDDRAHGIRRKHWDPPRLPPATVSSSKATCPDNRRATARRLGMTTAAASACPPPSSNACHRFVKSTAAAAASDPDFATGLRSFVTEAGLVSAMAATAGSKNCPSMKYRLRGQAVTEMATVRSHVSFRSSRLVTTMPTAASGASVVLSNAAGPRRPGSRECPPTRPPIALSFRSALAAETAPAAGPADRRP